MNWDREKAQNSILAFVFMVLLAFPIIYFTLNYDPFIAKIFGGIVLLALVYFLGGFTRGVA